jgi:restriction endonuclease Mrr
MSTDAHNSQSSIARMPDESAIDYLNDLLHEAKELAQKGDESDLPASEDERVGNEEDEENDFNLLRAIHHKRDGYAPSDSKLARMYEEEDEYEAEADFSSSDIERIEDAYEQARIALAERRFVEFSDALDTLISFIGKEAQGFADSANVENWLNLVEPSTEKREDGIDVVEAVKAAVKNLSVELVKLIAERQDALHAIEWRQLEHVVATALEGLGFHVELTPPSKDGGKDVIASCWLKGQKKAYFIEIKHWRSGKRVLSQSVFDFLEVNVREKSDGGVFISTSGFSSCAYSCLTEFQKANIHLGDSNKIVWMCRQFVRTAGGIWKTGTNLSDLLFKAAAIRPDQTSGSQQYHR